MLPEHWQQMPLAAKALYPADEYAVKYQIMHSQHLAKRMKKNNHL